MDLVADAENMRREFLQILADKRPGMVPLCVEPAKPVTNPMYQADTSLEFSKAMAACPRKDVPNLEEALEEENLYLTTEAGEQGRLPVLILKLKDSNLKERPAVVCLHSSYKCKEWLRPLLEAYASRGYIAVAVDSRYHGERATYKTAYSDALVSAWKTGQSMPFIFDTVWDLLKLMDYLSTREDINPSCIGITGESLGGMHAWFAAVADPRYAVVVPIIGVQGFGWAVENNRWHARVASIKNVFEEAKSDLGKSSIDAEVVQIVWDRIAPGLRDKFDAPATIPSIVPRPLLILNGEKDPRCPVEGLEESISRATEVYSKANASDKFKFIAESGVGHCMTPFMVKEASDWIDKYLMIDNILCDAQVGYIN
uniref:Peptidase S9 prolyl oligopeptidase catalytic domain-containing protein n=1 Tax=Araucaria cunninghamii TaxID=56994 RepID=A0A0D6R046_ARACU